MQDEAGNNMQKLVKKCLKYKWITAMVVISAAYLLYRRVVPTVYATISYEFMKARVTNFMAGFNVTNFKHMQEAYTSMKEFTSKTTSDSVKTLGRFITALAGIMVVIFTAVGIVKESEKGEISMDYWYRIIISTVVAIIVILNISTVMDGIYGTGDFMVTTVSYYMEKDQITISPDETGDETNRKTFLNALAGLPGLSGDENGVNSIADLMEAGEGDINYWAMQEVDNMLTILQFAAYAPLVICMFLIYSAIFEIKIRQLFAPMAVATIAYEGGRSSGVRFLKKYLACFIKIAIYFFIAAIGSEMTHFFFLKLIGNSGAEKGDPGQVILLVMMMLSNIIAAMSMMQTGGLGDEIVGA